MDYLYIILIALPIAMVAFTAAFWGGVYRCLCFSEKLKMAFTFAIVQAAMFWLGSWTGNTFANSLAWLSIPFAEAIILLVALKIVYGAFRIRPEQKSYNLAKNWELIAVAFASSLNAFMIGLGTGLLRPINEFLLFIIPASVLLFAYLGDYTGIRHGKYIFINIAGLLAGLSLLALGIILALDLYNII